ncbi:queuosine-tRNA galactosyltransferase-like [Amphiura filiformis]|uniref:queuosine-tRNA galactosyltransferase-like n=1 Tax=Amphiura filiformis TaxID=82378 RepID=UPI003B21DCC2
MAANDRTIDVSIILPVHNASKWLDECLNSVLEQNFEGTFELSAFNDASTDGSLDMLKRWEEKLEAADIPVTLGGHQGQQPKGVGFAKNQAVAQSRGRYLCFLDADDVMDTHRIELQYAASVDRQNAIIGCQFHREPANSTERYTHWCNTITEEQLYTQAYTSHGPTVIMPTWFCSRKLFDRIGGFDEKGKGVPEDLIFFLSHLHNGGNVHRVNQCLLMYRYHPEAATHSVHKDTIWTIRIEAFEKHVLSQWPLFTIWNAGKQGRRFYRSLTCKSQKKVVAFCDVDVKKIDKGAYIYEESQEIPKPQVEIVHFRDAHPPFVICMKQDLTGGEFESNLASLNLKEGKDYYFFS